MEMLYKLGRMPIGLTVPAFAILLVVFGIPIVLLFLTSLNVPAFSFANYQGIPSPAGEYSRAFPNYRSELGGYRDLRHHWISYCLCYRVRLKRLRVTLIVLVTIPYLTSLLVRTYAWIIILGDRGLVNNLLLDFQLTSSPLPLIYDRLAVYIGMVHIMLPVMILPLVSVMLGIDKSLMAAARSMGATPFSAFRRVFLPISLPGVRSGSLLVFVLCLGFYITPAALGGLRDAMLSTFIAAQVSSSFNMARTAASAFILLGIVAVVLAVFGLDLSGTQGRAARSGKSLWGRLSSFGVLTRNLNELATPYRAKRWAATLYQAGSNGRLWRITGTVFVPLVMFYLLLPGVVVIIMSFSAGTFLEFPPSAFSLQWYRSFIDDPSWTGAAWTSI